MDSENEKVFKNKKRLEKTTSIDIENKFEKFKHKVHHVLNSWWCIAFFTILTIWVLF